MEERKTAPYHWFLGTTEVALRVGTYSMNDRLFVGLMTIDEDGCFEPFADLTVNIPQYSLHPNEAFISGDFSESNLAFIREQGLGEILPYQVPSGYGLYSAVSFNMEKLREFDPHGVENHLQLQKPTNQRNTPLKQTAR